MRGNYFEVEKALWKLNDCKLSKTFLKRLSKWIIEYYGNVNVAQRLNLIAINELKNRKK